MPKTPPCRCEAHPFPHRSNDRACTELREANESYYGDDVMSFPGSCATRDVIDADRASRGRDCRMASL
jgi:hypothetical protein